MNTFTKYALLVSAFFYSITVGAYDFEVDGIYYNVTSITELTVETTNNASNPNTYGEGDNSYYSSNGEITIPSTVIYNGFTFSVTAIGDGTFKNCTSLRYIHIPNTIIEVGGSAFSECSNLQEFVFPNSVKSIGYGCFYNCRNLSKLIFPEGLKTIPDHCCYYCVSLKEITIPSSVETISCFAFAHGIEYVVCKSNNAPSIFADYNRTFKYTTPKYIYIPKGSIESYREKKWPGEYVEYENGTLTIYPTFESNSFTYETTKLSGGFEVAIIDFSDKEAIDLQIPTNVLYEGINYIPTSISSVVFADCTQAETLTIPNNIKSIGVNSFSGCSSLKTIISHITQPMAVQAFSNYQYMFTTLKVPTGTIELYKQTDGWKEFINIQVSDYADYKLTYVVDGDEYASYTLTEGESITPETEPTKEGYTFSGWSDIPSTMPAHDVTVTGSFTVNKYKLTYKVDGVVYKTYDIEYGATITPEPAPTKEGYTFSGWSEIPETMPAHDVTVTSTFIASVVSDFKYNGIKYTVVSQSDKTVEVAASNQSAGSDGPTSYSGDIVIPSTVSYGDKTYTVIGIGQSAFVNCVGITSVSLPNTLTYIRKEAFNLCLSLRSITIPESVTSYGYDVFSVTSISEITVLNPVPVEIPYNAFYYPQSNNNCILYVPYGSSNAYKNAAEWKKFKTIVEMGKKPDMLDGHEYVDLGLPSGKCWATMNYGATSPEGYGSYLEWSSNSIISSNWGSGWTTPSLQDIRELENNCTWTWGQKNGHSGYTVKGKNGNSIFLPASGYMMMGQSSAGKVDQWVYYWTSTKSGEMAYIIMSTATDVWYGEMNTVYTQLPIRPITKESHSTVVQKCETPIISYINGKLTFACSTEGATCQYSITDSDIKVGSGNEVQLSVTYNISVYATKSGYENSETANATLCWIDQQPKVEGDINGIANVPAKALLIKNNGGQLTIEGIDDGQAVELYSLNGEKRGSTIGKNGVACIDTNVRPGSIVVVKMGEKSVKVIVK